MKTYTRNVTLADLPAFQELLRKTNAIVHLRYRKTANQRAHRARVKADQEAAAYAQALGYDVAWEKSTREFEDAQQEGRA